MKFANFVVTFILAFTLCAARTALAQSCPAGLACFYVPPILTAPVIAPTNYGGDIVLASPTVNATVTYAFGTLSPTTVTVNAGTATIISIPPASGMMSGFEIAEQHGALFTSTAADLVVEQRVTATSWQSSSTIKSNSIGLGTHFRVAGYSLSSASGSDGTGYDYVAIYAPAATTVTLTAPSALWQSHTGTTVTFSLVAKQTYVIRTLAGIDIDGTAVDATSPVSVVVGGRGWGGGSGDDGADGIVPMAFAGEQFVVTQWSPTVLQDVRIVADSANTSVSINGSVVTTLGAGGVYKFTPTGVTFIQTSNPVAVYQNATNVQTNPENDLNLIPPVYFANVPKLAITLNVLTGDSGVLFILVPTASASSLRLDGATFTPASSSTVTGHSEWTAIKTATLTAGTHSITGASDFQLSMCSGGGGTGLFSSNSPYRRVSCGNGVVDSGEACDDGNIVGGDGCSAVCVVETGFTCTGAPSSCACAADSACPSGTYCTSGTSPNSCVMALADGAAIPSDHGSCGASSGSIGAAGAACASNQCNAVTDTCGDVPAAACTDAGQCADNICDTDGACGSQNGETCTQNSACRSGNCVAFCIPAGATGCSADSQCAASQYCNQTFCATKLSAGTSIPSDSLHDGACDAASAVCASGLCDAQTSTCALAGGSSCTSANQCVSNICGSNGSCRLATGQSGCSTVTAGALCQSGFCSANGGVCVPASTSCWVDNDCASTQFCQRNTYTCVNKSDNGTAISSDTLHNGSCTVANATAVCASGQCNTSTSTCAGPNLVTACALANACVSNLCGSNGSCGLANGQTSCTTTNQATVCQSGVCSAHASACVPVAGCDVDADCSTGNFCAQNTFTCTTLLPTGTALPSDGLHGSCTSGANAACASGACNATTSTCAGANGTSCTNANQCVANFCGTNGLCGLANGQATCGANTDCQSGDCTSGLCVPPGGCAIDANCTVGQYCNRTSFVCAGDLAAGQSIPNDGLHGGTCADAATVCQSGLCDSVTYTCALANGLACGAPNQCVSNICGTNALCGRASGGLGCSSASDCQSGVCDSAGACIPATNGCYVDSDCSAEQRCDRTSLTCADKLAPGAAIPSDGLHGGTCADAGAVCVSGLCDTQTSTCAAANSIACSADNQCVSNVCGTNALCGLANVQGTCNAGNASTLCQSGVCSQGGVCIASGGCYVDGDCATGTYCDRATLACVGKISAGNAIPNDGLHDGTCNAASTCLSGLCDGTTHTCAVANGQACTSANQCVSNACGSNGVCGLADGQSGCDSSTAAALCQSGTCIVTTCVPSTNGCIDDSECPNGWCDRTTDTCAAKLPPGAPLPNDGLHVGSCADATSVCASHACNSAALTCGDTSGATCANPAECATNICGSNQGCGIASGDSGCSSEAACQSGVCNPGGVCVDIGSCYVDADCASGAYCNRLTFACTATLAIGATVPSDGLHHGTCSDAASVCASGACNATTLTCALPSGSSGCTEAADCVSGVCNPNGTCVAPSNCFADSDCPSSQWCNRSTLVCADDLSAGATLPSDGNHDGTCATAGNVCATGLCNPRTNTCASENSTSCQSAAACVSNVCGADAVCGQPGAAACTQDAECRSGTCVSGECTRPTAFASGGGVFSCRGAPGNDASILALAFVLLRMLRRNKRQWVIGVMLVAAAAPARAADAPFASDRYLPADAGSRWQLSESLSFPSVEPTPHAVLDSLSLRLDTAYAADPVVVRTSQGIVDATIANQLTAHIAAAISPWRFLRVSVDLPVQLFANGTGSTDANGFVAAPSQAAALGDLRFGVIGRFYGDADGRLRLGASARLSVPTGKPSAYSGDGDASGSLAFNAAGDLSRFAWSWALGVRWRRGVDDTFAGIAVGPEAFVSGGVGVQTNDHRLLVGLELPMTTTLSAPRPLSSANFYAEPTLGAHWRFAPHWRIHGAVGSGLARALGTPLARVALAIEWSAARD